jgi:hypothetical protein
VSKLELVVCESTAAIVPHLRIVTLEAPICLNGHSPRPSALCGSEIAWDTQLPLNAARCRSCLTKRAELEAQ